MTNSNDRKFNRESKLSDKQIQDFVYRMKHQNSSSSKQELEESDKSKSKQNINRGVNMRVIKLNEDVTTKCPTCKKDMVEGKCPECDALMEGPLSMLKNLGKNAIDKAKKFGNNVAQSDNVSEFKARQNQDKVLDKLDNSKDAKNWTYIVDGKELSHSQAMELPIKKRANAIVFDPRTKMYIRKGLEDVSKQYLRRRNSSTDEVDKNYTYLSNKEKPAPAPKEEKPAKETKEKLPNIKGDFRDWAYVKKDGDTEEYFSYAELCGDGDTPNFDGVDAIVDTRKKRYEWRDAQKIVNAKKSSEEEGRIARDNAAAKKDAEAAAKAQADAAKGEEKNRRNQEVTQTKIVAADNKRNLPTGKPKNWTFKDSDGKKITLKDYKKLSPTQQKEYTLVDEKGKEFNYSTIQKYSKLKKVLNASLEQDVDTDDDFTLNESYSLAKKSVDYDDDFDGYQIDLGYEIDGKIDDSFN